MIAFAMIVRDVFGHDLPEVPLAQWNEAIETFLFDRADETLSVGIGVSSRLHRQRAVRHKLSRSRIPSIRCMAGRFS